MRTWQENSYKWVSLDLVDMQTTKEDASTPNRLFSSFPEVQGKNRKPKAPPYSIRNGSKQSKIPSTKNKKSNGDSYMDDTYE